MTLNNAYFSSTINNLNDVSHIYGSKPTCPQKKTREQKHL